MNAEKAFKIFMTLIAALSLGGFIHTIASAKSEGGKDFSESLRQAEMDVIQKTFTAQPPHPHLLQTVKRVFHETHYTERDYMLARLIRMRYNQKSFAFDLKVAHYINKYTKGKIWPSPLDVAAIIEIESQYNQNAVSSCGARGLMQISPIWSNVVPASAYHSVRVNIQYGIDILSKFYSRYDGNVSAAILSYNSGPRAYNAGQAWPGYWYRYENAHTAFETLYNQTF